ncbi:MAG: hypothetical protein ACREMR_02320 [Gemmatimonadales bacterium]
MLAICPLGVSPGLAPGVSGSPDTIGYWQQEVAYHITASLDEPSGAADVAAGGDRVALRWPVSLESSL